MPDVRIVPHRPSQPVNFQRYGETPIWRILSDFVSLGQLIGDSNRLTHLHSPASQGDVWQVVALSLFTQKRKWTMKKLALARGEIKMIMLLTHRSDLRKQLNEVLQASGYSVAIPSHREERLSMLIECRPVLIILDLYVSDPDVELRG